MSKTLSNILTSPISLIDQRAGDIISGIFITAVGVATGNPALIAFGTARLESALTPLPPRPPLTEVAVKSPVVARQSRYGAAGSSFSWKPA